MKKIQLLLSIFVLTILASCSKDKEVYNVDSIGAPTNLSATMLVKPDNSGTVTITPSGEGVTKFQVFFGDGTTAPATVNIGSSVDHVYIEGTFQVKIVGTTLSGKTAEVTLPLTVSFFAPTNLVVTKTLDPLNTMAISVKATADFESGFKIYFGEFPLAAPVIYHEGDADVAYTYTTPGTYQLKVVAYTGGVAFVQNIQSVTVTASTILQMPLDFQSATLPYTFTSFAGANTVVITNPQQNGINTSTKVAEFTKGNGALTYAGSIIQMSSAINFSVMKKIKMKVWVPTAGIVVKMKLENATNSGINIERDANATTTSGWQELTYDFTGISTTSAYHKIIVFFDFGNVGTNKKYYFDDILQSN
jgi:hypothetical protein